MQGARSKTYLSLLPAPVHLELDLERQVPPILRVGIPKLYRRKHHVSTIPKARAVL